MSEELTREQVEGDCETIKECCESMTVDEHLDGILAHDLVQRATIQQQAQRIESLESTNRIAALSLAEKEAEIARLKRDVNIILNRGLGIDWKAEAKWAAEFVLAHAPEKATGQRNRAQRILEEA